MTLYRLLASGILFFLLVLFTATIWLTTKNLRNTYESELAAHVQDTATVLGIALSGYAGNADVIVQQSLVNAVFDRGEFRRIDITGPDTGSHHRSADTALTSTIPRWFINAVSLNDPVADAPIMSGWKQAGTVSVTGNTHAVYTSLWTGFLHITRMYLAISLVVLALALMLARLMLRPMAGIREQADAICNRKFIQQDRLPAIQEFRSVVYAMNSLSAKMEEIFHQQAEQAEALQREIYLDPVTGIGNRRYFERISTALVEDLEQTSQGNLILVEISALAATNRQYGYHQGDALLKSAAGLLLERISVLDNTYIARISGACFAVISVGSGPGYGETLATVLCQSLYQLRANGLTDSNDIGHASIASWNERYRVSYLLAEADHALNDARTSGQNNWIRFTPDTGNHAQLRGESEWRAFFGTIPDVATVTLFTQPVFGTGSSSGRILHQEILARITDSSGSLLPATYFMPMAERTGNASRIDRLVAAQLLDHMTRTTDRPARTALNISGASLHDTLFMQWLCTTLKRLPLIAKQIVVVLHERTIISDPGYARLQINRLKECGVHCGISHFGQGLGSFGYLRSSDIQHVQLDSSITRNIDQLPDSQFYAKSLTDTLHTLGIKVYAQAIQSTAEKDLCMSLGIDGIQGYLLERPAELSRNIQI